MGDRNLVDRYMMPQDCLDLVTDIGVARIFANRLGLDRQTIDDLSQRIDGLQYKYITQAIRTAVPAVLGMAVILHGQEIADYVSKLLPLSEDAVKGLGGAILGLSISHIARNVNIYQQMGSLRPKE
jgi:hypothetical protein